MKLPYFFLLCFLLSLAPLSMQAGSPQPHPTTSDLQPASPALQLKPHQPKKWKRAVRHLFARKKISADSEKANRMGKWSFWTGLGSFLLIALTNPVTLVIGLILLAASGALGFTAWRNKPTQKLAKIGAVLGMAYTGIILIGMAVGVVALVLWLI